MRADEAFDLAAITASDDPDTFWSEVRQDRPVFHSKEHGCWFVTRSEDVRRVLSDPTIFSSREAFTSHLELPQSVLDILGEAQFMDQNPINIDPPAHTPIRRIWGRALMRRQVSDLEPHLNAVAGSLAESMAAKGTGTDLMQGFASPFPAAVVLCSLLGVNLEDVPQHIGWGQGVALLLGADASLEELERAARLHVEHLAYWSEQLEDRRRSPRGDLLTAFVEECEAEESIDLSPRGLAYLPLAISTAGHVTTAQAIAFGTLLLSAHPDQRAAALADPAVMATAADEILRLEAPAQMLRRTTVAEVELGGVTIPAGARVMAVTGSANRDPDAYESDPSTFDVTRTDAAEHSSFGRGAHFCLGASLARRELAVAMTALFTRFPDLRPAADHGRHRRRHSFHRGYERLDVEWG